MAIKKQGYARSQHMQEIREQTTGEIVDEAVDTSDIKEADEEWFKKAKLKLPKEEKPIEAASKNSTESV